MPRQGMGADVYRKIGESEKSGGRKIGGSGLNNGRGDALPEKSGPGRKTRTGLTPGGTPGRSIIVAACEKSNVSPGVKIEKESLFQKKDGQWGGSMAWPIWKTCPDRAVAEKGSGAVCACCLCHTPPFEGSCGSIDPGGSTNVTKNGAWTKGFFSSTSLAW